MYTLILILTKKSIIKNILKKFKLKDLYITRLLKDLFKINT